MKFDSEPDWALIKQRIETVLDQARAELDADSIAFVEHRVAHDEFETAFEGLCLSLCNLRDDAKAKVDWVQCRDLARLLKLDRTPVLDDSFWEKVFGKSADSS